MIYKLISISLLIIIAFISNNYCYDSEDDNESCDPSKPHVPYLNGTSGKLTIKNINQQKGNESTCIWIIDGTNLTNTNIHLDISKLSIGINDTLKVTSNEKSSLNSILYELNGYQSPGVILTNAKNITVTLSLTKELIDREFGVNYGSNVTSAQLQNIEGPGSYVFAYYNTSLDLTLNFDLTLSTAINGKKLLMSFVTFEVTDQTTVAVKDAANVANDTKIDKTKLSFLLSNDNKINLNIGGFKTSKTLKGIRLNYELVDSVCSKYKSIEKTDLDNNSTFNMELPFGYGLDSLTSFKCFNLFEHNNSDAKFLLDTSQFKFINSYDTLTVRDGNSPDSKLLALIEPEPAFFDYWNQLYLFSTSNQIWLLYDSPIVVNKTSFMTILGVKAKSQGGTVVLDKNFNQTSLKLKKSSEPTVIFNILVDEGYQPVLDFPDDKKLPGDQNQTFMVIYDTDSRFGLPLIKLQENSFPPSIMASNTRNMIIQFNPIYDFEVTLLQIKKGCHSSVSDVSNSFSLSGCQNMCSWLIPNRTSSNGTYIIQFSHLYLPLETDSILVEKLGAIKSTVFQLKGPLKTKTFPDLNLDPSYSYVLYTERKCSDNSTDGENLLGVSLIYVKEDLLSHVMNISSDETIAISSENHPNYYSVGSDHLWRIDGGVGRSVLITLTDLDLTPIHQLDLTSANGTENLTKDNLLPETSDYLVSLPLFLNLSSHSIGTKEPFSARGFSANLTETRCGNAFNMTGVKSLTISTPKSLTDITKCIWTVTVNNGINGVINLLHFNITSGKDVDKNMTGLKIYDSNTIRNNQIMNLTYFNTTKSSSTNSIIIEYSISDPKKDLSFNFNIIACNYTTCGNPKRCMLEEFFCNGFNDCGDWSDEKWCNNSQPIPPPPQPSPQPSPQVKTGGVNGWVVLFVICPLCVGLGVAGTIFGPTLMGRFRRGRYREFQDFSEVS